MENSSLERRNSAIQGQGLFALRNFKSGELIYTFPVGRRVLSSEINSLTADEKNRLGKRGQGVYELMEPPTCQINHSCSPNVIERDHAGYALHDIAIGEELTLDYTVDMEGSMVCNCASPNCKKLIDEKLQILYLQYYKK